MVGVILTGNLIKLLSNQVGASIEIISVDEGLLASRTHGTIDNRLSQTLKLMNIQIATICINVNVESLQDFTEEVEIFDF